MVQAGPPVADVTDREGMLWGQQRGGPLCFLLSLAVNVKLLWKVKFSLKSPRVLSQTGRSDSASEEGRMPLSVIHAGVREAAARLSGFRCGGPRGATAGGGGCEDRCSAPLCQVSRATAQAPPSPPHTQLCPPRLPQGLGRQGTSPRGRKRVCEFGACHFNARS